MKVGFTGTRDGMTAAQKRTVLNMLEEMKPDEAHQGCCVGADEDFAMLIAWCGDDCRTEGHPSTLTGMTSRRAVGLCDVVHPALPPLDRNHNIVDATELLIAAPKEEKEQQRSGTWATVRYARKKGKPVRVVLPDGEILTEDR